MDNARLLHRFFDVIENDIAPLTRRGVAAGNKIFGAAILKKDDLSLVIAETNNETENPLWHGEMHALKKLYERDHAGLPAPRDCLFLATHEPCSLCLSAITWGGYDNFYYLFSHQQSRDAFAIPHDIRILKEVFAVPCPPAPAVENRAGTGDTGNISRFDDSRPLYNRTNAFWTSHAIEQMIAALDRGNRESLLQRLDDVTALYADLSAIYQAGKGQRGIPLA